MLNLAAENFVEFAADFVQHFRDIPLQ